MMKKIKKLMILALSFSMILNTFAFANTNEPSVNAETAILVEKETGKVLRLLRGQAKIKMKKKLKLLGKLKQNKLVDNEFIRVRLNAYKGHLKGSDTHKLLYFYTKKNNL